MKFKAGDRVRVYREGMVFDGTVLRETPRMPVSDWINVEDDKGIKIRPHYKQCRRLRPKPKSVRVTRESLANAWDNVVAPNSAFVSARGHAIFKELCRALGLDESEGK
jgi:hypothetical protein